jgi:aspartate/methionine/tyrosine aminotransferase
VAVAPGVDFDPSDGGRFIRLSFAGATEDITETLERLAAWLPRS